MVGWDAEKARKNGKTDMPHCDKFANELAQKRAKQDGKLGESFGRKSMQKRASAVKKTASKSASRVKSSAKRVVSKVKSSAKKVGATVAGGLKLKRKAIQFLQEFVKKKFPPVVQELKPIFAKLIPLAFDLKWNKIFKILKEDAWSKCDVGCGVTFKNFEEHGVIVPWMRKMGPKYVVLKLMSNSKVIAKRKVSDPQYQPADGYQKLCENVQILVPPAQFTYPLFPSSDFAPYMGGCYVANSSEIIETQLKGKERDIKECWEGYHKAYSPVMRLYVNRYAFLQMNKLLA